MSLTTEQRNSQLEALKENGWVLTEGRDAIEKTFNFKVSSAPYGSTTSDPVYVLRVPLFLNAVHCAKYK